MYKSTRSLLSQAASFFKTKENSSFFERMAKNVDELPADAATSVNKHQWFIKMYEMDSESKIDRFSTSHDTK